MPDYLNMPCKPDPYSKYSKNNINYCVTRIIEKEIQLCLGKQTFSTFLVNRKKFNGEWIYLFANVLMLNMFL